jgi:hypothetical protein
LNSINIEGGEGKKEVTLQNDYSQECPSLSGSDTRTRITIIDDDFPGMLGLTAKEIDIHKSEGKLMLSIERTNGSDGKISCRVKTEPYIDDERKAVL